jgi:hypothetical protein
MNQAYQPWLVAALIADPSKRPRTALADALLAALAKAVHDPGHPLCQQTFGYYGSLEALRAAKQIRVGRSPGI